MAISTITTLCCITLSIIAIPSVHVNAYVPFSLPRHDHQQHRHVVTRTFLTPNSNNNNHRLLANDGSVFSTFISDDVVTTETKDVFADETNEWDYSTSSSLQTRSLTADIVNNAAASADTTTVESTTITAVKDATDNEESRTASDFTKGFAIIGLITLFNASLSPVWHVVFQDGVSPPPLFLNAAVSVTAFLGLLVGGPFLDKSVGSVSGLADATEQKWSAKSFRGGMELGLWKGIGTMAHIGGMALTTANHGAFLLQMTTLIVPVMQGFLGEKIPRKVQMAVVLALMGIVAFTQDPTGTQDALANADQIRLGDGLVLTAAFFYSIYDLQTFYWGKKVPRNELVTIKVGFQAILSCIVCAVVASGDTMDYLSSQPNWRLFTPTVLWSGLIVNALATFLQIGGMQAIGPTRAQTIFASQPLCAALMNFAFLGEIIGMQGFVGGGAFVGALVLAATSKPSDYEEEDASATENA